MRVAVLAVVVDIEPEAKVVLAELRNRVVEVAPHRLVSITAKLERLCLARNLQVGVHSRHLRSRHEILLGLLQRRNRHLVDLNLLLLEEVVGHDLLCIEREHVHATRARLIVAIHLPHVVQRPEGPVCPGVQHVEEQLRNPRVPFRLLDERLGFGLLILGE